ncbi:UNVERIFIED_CONTAM: hypothetical protein FKN15_040767 [Acipenser sinensis]
MRTFAGSVFSHFRQRLGMTEKEYQLSLSSKGLYLQFISNSKSKADFFLTNDKRFFLKTQNKKEVRFLLSNLRVYMEHLEKYPHSLIVKFLGVHRIKIPNQGKKYFIVMQSVFYPDERISERYDIKGCQVSRWTDPAPESSQEIVVLKDLNFEGKYICVDQQRAWLVRQMEIDSQFLQGLNVLDYSLLVAVQPLHVDERMKSQSLASLIIRTKQYVFPAHQRVRERASPPLTTQCTRSPSQQQCSCQWRTMRDRHPGSLIVLLPGAGSTLVKVGESQRRLGGAEREFMQSTAINFLTPLRNFLEGDWRTISKERRLLENRRLDLDACKARLKKAKTAEAKAAKERRLLENRRLDLDACKARLKKAKTAEAKAAAIPDFQETRSRNYVLSASASAADHELRVAQTEFDRQAEVTRLLLEGISSTHVNHLRCLHEFVEAQATYYAQSHQYMQDLQKQLGRFPNTFVNTNPTPVPSGSSPSSAATLPVQPSSSPLDTGTLSIEEVQPPATGTRKAKVLYDYDAADTSELSLLADEEKLVPM